MINLVVLVFRETSLKHKAVKTFKYQDRIDINQLPNNKVYLVVLESDYLMSFNNERGILTINMNVLGFVNKDNNEEEVQDIAGQIALSILHKAVNDNRNIISLSSYDILGITHFSDDNNAGVRLTIKLAIPEFIDYCVEDEYWLTDEEYEEKIAIPEGLDLGEPKEYKGLDLKPLKL